MYLHLKPFFSKKRLLTELHYTLLTKINQMFFKANQLTLLTILNVNDYILSIKVSQYFPIN